MPNTEDGVAGVTQDAVPGESYTYKFVASIPGTYWYHSHTNISDQYILTLDDLNTVPQNEMVRTMEYLNNTFGNGKGIIIADRTIAIKTAIEQSNPGDWIIITGKGHEKYQQNYHLPTESDKETVTFLNDQLKHNCTRSRGLT